MKFEVKPNELNQVREIMREDSERIDEEITAMFEIKTQLGNIWKGKDFEEFSRSYSAYLSKLKEIPKALNDIEFFINKANKAYCEKDIDLQQRLERSNQIMKNDIIYISNFSEFKLIISKLRNNLENIKNLFNNEKNNIEKINGTDVWNGMTQTIIYNKFKELEKNFPDVEKALSTYIMFLETALENYQKLESNIKENIDDNSDNLNVN